ncbi:protein of unknown function [Methylorubrum extorquens]|uniref:Uncharacterized protein n=1 Tax=Methylorubrum extorquens TaxID=408 RepID=A0A2N9AKA8_METEX|nr:protein of unknown function [Methylorubrum extorquens]
MGAISRMNYNLIAINLDTFDF